MNLQSYFTPQNLIIGAVVYYLIYQVYKKEHFKLPRPRISVPKTNQKIKKTIKSKINVPEETYPEEMMEEEYYPEEMEEETYPEEVMEEKSGNTLMYVGGSIVVIALVIFFVRSRM